MRFGGGDEELMHCLRLDFEQIMYSEHVETLCDLDYMGLHFGNKAVL